MIERYLRNGKITLIPKKQKAKKLVFDYIYDQIHPLGRVFSEKEINQAIQVHYDDYVTMRRDLVDNGYLERDDYGQEYRLLEKERP